MSLREFLSDRLGRMAGQLACAARLIDRPEPITPQELLPLFSWETLPKQDIATEYLPRGISQN